MEHPAAISFSSPTTTLTSARHCLAHPHICCLNMSKCCMDMCAPIKGCADCLQHFVLPILPCKICPCFCYIWNWVSEIQTFPSCRISHSAKQVLWHKFTKYWPWKPRNVQAKRCYRQKGCDYGLDWFGLNDLNILFQVLVLAWHRPCLQRSTATWHLGRLGMPKIELLLLPSSSCYLLFSGTGM